MRLVSVNNCKTGMKLARPIYDKDNRMLLNTGFTLTESTIKRISELGVSYIYIDSLLTNDITIEELSPKIRHQAEKKIGELFDSIKTGKHKSNNVTNGQMIREFTVVFNKLLDEMKSKKGLVTLLTHIQANDEYVFEHSLNVTLYSLAIAKKMHYNDKDLYSIGLGAILHDIGKTFISPDILNKKGKLTKEEFEEVQKHTEYGFELLRKEHGIPLLVAHCAFQHHEKVDGTGYPRKLKGEQIHPFAKILAVADVFDALTSHRCYRKAMLPHEAMEILMAGCHTHFDANVLNAFKDAVALYPIGLTVKLNTGEIGVVSSYNNNTPQRPNIRVFKDTNQNEIEPYEMDLSKQLSVMIVQTDAILDESDSTILANAG